MTDKISGKMDDSEKGLTLLELTVALALFGILSVAVLNLLYSGVRSHKFMENRIETVNNLNFALGFMTKAIRESKASDLKIEEENQSFKVLDYSDTNPQNGNIRKCKLQVIDGVLKRNISGVTQDLTTKDKFEVTSLDFVMGRNNNVEIEITVKSRDGKTVTAKSEAAVRSGL